MIKARRVVMFGAQWLGVFLFLKPGVVLADDIIAPKDWIDSFGGVGVISGKGLDFVTGNVVPFITSGLLWLAIILSVIFLMIGGIRLMMSQGDKQNVAAAQGMIMYALIGLGLALSSFLILTIIEYVLGYPLGAGYRRTVPPSCIIKGVGCP